MKHLTLIAVWIVLLALATAQKLPIVPQTLSQSLLPNTASQNLNTMFPQLTQSLGDSLLSGSADNKALGTTTWYSKNFKNISGFKEADEATKKRYGS